MSILVTFRARSAFTLLELTVVLLIIALLTGVGVTMGQDAMKAADRVTTTERLNTIKFALDSFAKTYGYVPCPFDRNLTPTNAGYGVENRVAASSNCGATNGSSFINNGTIVTGGVPVRTLGLPDNYASDAWGNKFTYVAGVLMARGPDGYANYLASGITIRTGNRTTYFNVPYFRNSLTGGTASSNAGKLRVTYGSTGSLTTAMTVYISSVDYKGSYTPSAKTATTVDFNGITYTNPDTGAVTLEWQEPGTNASYIVISHGPDGRGAYPANATALPSNKLCNTSATANSSPPPCTSSASTTCIDIENCNNDGVFFDTTYNDGSIAASYFDDYVVWGSNDLFRKTIKPDLYFKTSTSNCTGACENWCASCAVNYPGTDTSNIPPLPINGNAVLFRKVLTSASATCSASCFWSGDTSAPGYQKVP